MNKILITGANGFVGLSLAEFLTEKNYELVLAYRKILSEHKESSNAFAVGDINSETSWQNVLQGIDAIIHLAARVHVMQETENDPLQAFRQVNTQGSLNLAKQAAQAGVKRFIYLSSIKVNGESTENIAFFADDEANPQDPYAVSKFETEQQLLELGKATGLEIVIIRPPLVYGVGVKGNFQRIISLMNKSLPLPFAKIDNQRSLVNITNLCSLIESCINHPKAIGEVFLVSDGEDLSTSSLLMKVATALDRKHHLFYFPPIIFKWLMVLIGKRGVYDRLFGSLQVNIEKNNRLLNWQPELSVDEGISQSVLQEKR